MRKLYRSSRDKKIFGVCGGLAEYLGVDATLLRILLIVVAVFSAGSVVLVYILAGFIIPREYPGGFGPGPSPYSHGWPGAGGGVDTHHQPRYGTQGWPPGSQWPGAGVPPTPPPTRPAAAQEPTPRPQGLDAMMEDIEKKALRREIEELKQKISKIEKDSKGE